MAIRMIRKRGGERNVILLFKVSSAAENDVLSLSADLAAVTRVSRRFSVSTWAGFQPSCRACLLIGWESDCAVPEQIDSISERDSTDNHAGTIHFAQP